MSDPGFRQYRPVALRVWHWLGALTVLGLLGTVVLRKTFLSWRTNAGVIQQEASELGVTGLTAEGAGAIARALRAPMWEWHYVLGFALVGLLLLRLVLGFARRELAPVRSVLREAEAYRALATPREGSALHRLLVKAGYALFYAAVLFMCTSGLALYFKQELGLSRALAGNVKEAHELAMWFFALFVPAHLLGVVVAELRGERGLVSDMIHGG